MLHKAGAMAAFREKQGGLKANTKRKEVDIQIRGRQNVHAEKRCATTSEQGFGALQIRVVFVRSTARGNGKARKRPSLQSSAGLQVLLKNRIGLPAKTSQNS